MCKLCKTMKRNKAYKKRKTSPKRRRKPAAVGKLNTNNLILQAAGVGGAATAAASDAIWQRIEFLKDDQLKVGAAKGLLGWILANNPTQSPSLNNPMLMEFGKGMCYFGWGQMTNAGLKLDGYINKAVGVNGIETPEAPPMEQSNFIAAVDYYEMLSAEMEEGENAELSGYEETSSNNKLMV